MRRYVINFPIQARYYIQRLAIHQYIALVIVNLRLQPYLLFSPHERLHSTRNMFPVEVDDSVGKFAVKAFAFLYIFAFSATGKSSRFQSSTQIDRQSMQLSFLRVELFVTTNMISKTDQMRSSLSRSHRRCS